MNQAAEKSNRTKRRSESVFDDDLEWLLIAGASAMRERGTLGAVVNVLELGGVDGGVPNTDFYTDAQVGFGKHPLGDVERYRWLSGVWRQVDRPNQAVLLACYAAPRAEFRSDAGFGARDSCPAVEELKRGGVVEPAMGRHAAVTRGEEAILGEMTGAVFWLSQDPERLAHALDQLRRPDKGGRHAAARKLLKREANAARAAAIEAHKVWREKKTGKPRRRRERVPVQPVWVRPQEVP